MEICLLSFLLNILTVSTLRFNNRLVSAVPKEPVPPVIKIFLPANIFIKNNSYTKMLTMILYLSNFLFFKSKIIKVFNSNLVIFV